MIKQEFLRLANLYPVTAAIKTAEEVEVALAGDVRLLFMLKGNAFELETLVKRVHGRGKGLVVHVDLVGGIGKDRSGIHYLRQLGVDAIITSKAQLVAAGRAEGLTTIQRLLLVDDSALDSGAKSVSKAAPDIIEILPGILFPEFAARLQALLPGPFIAGGFIRSEQEVARVLAAGCVACSTSSHDLWKR